MFRGLKKWANAGPSNGHYYLSEVPMELNEALDTEFLIQSFSRDKLMLKNRGVSAGVNITSRVLWFYTDTLWLEFTIHYPTDTSSDPCLLIQLIKRYQGGSPTAVIERFTLEKISSEQAMGLISLLSCNCFNPNYINESGISALDDPRALAQYLACGHPLIYKQVRSAARVILLS